MKSEITKKNLEDFFAKCLGVSSIDKIEPETLILKYDKKVIKIFLSRVDSLPKEPEISGRKNGFKKLIEDRVVFSLFLYVSLISRKKPCQIINLDWTDADKYFTRPEIDTTELVVLHEKMAQLYIVYKNAMVNLYKAFDMKTYKVFVNATDITFLTDHTGVSWIDAKKTKENLLNWKSDVKPWYRKKVKGTVLEECQFEDFAKVIITKAKNPNTENNIGIRSNWQYTPYCKKRQKTQT